MLKTLTGRLAVAGVLALSASGAMAVPMAVDPGIATNGITDLYSGTFDAALSPCAGGSTQSYCAFFGGNAPTTPRAIVTVPDPTGVATNVPLGIAGPPAAGSFLDISLTGGNTTAQIVGNSTISLPALTLVIGGATTVTTAATAGFVILPSGTAAINANGQVEFLVNNAPGLAADFSTLTTPGIITGCVGPACGLLGSLSLDMVRYRLFLDFDPTFTSFTGNFIGQTSNNTMLCVNLDSTGSGGGSNCQLAAVPVPAAAWFMASGLGLLAGLRRRIKTA